MEIFYSSLRIKHKNVFCAASIDDHDRSTRNRVIFYLRIKRDRRRSHEFIRTGTFLRKQNLPKKNEGYSLRTTINSPYMRVIISSN